MSKGEMAIFCRCSSLQSHEDLHLFREMCLHSYFFQGHCNANHVQLVGIKQASQQIKSTKNCQNSIRSNENMKLHYWPNV